MAVPVLGLLPHAFAPACAWRRGACRPTSRSRAWRRGTAPKLPSTSWTGGRRPSHSVVTGRSEGNRPVRGGSSYGRIEEKAPPFTAGMNPTTPPQPPVLSVLTAYLEVSTTGKKWRLAGVRPVDGGYHTVPHAGRPVAVGRRHSKSNPRSLVPAHRGLKGRQADGTARARTRGNLRPKAYPDSLTDGGYAQCKRIPRPFGRRTRHTPRGAYVPCVNPVLPHRTPSGGRKLPAGTWDRPAVVRQTQSVCRDDETAPPSRTIPRWNPRPSGRGGCQGHRLGVVQAVHAVTGGVVERPSGRSWCARWSHATPTSTRVMPPARAVSVLPGPSVASWETSRSVRPPVVP